jgi:outer membrane protein TolC
VGDLINPIYTTLNKLTPSGAQKFPEGAVPNVNEQLVPKNFYDMRLKTQMPLLNAEIKYNKQLKYDQLGIQQAEIQVFKRELVKETKIAYLNYLKTLEAIKIYENAKTLLKEAERVNVSLIKNDMANSTVLIKTKNEQAKIEADYFLAENNVENAKTYFKFLINTSNDLPINVDSTFGSISALDIADETSQKREELLKIGAAKKVNETILQLNKSYKTPKIGAILDFGSQGKVTNIQSKNAFVLLGVSFDLPVYAGNRNVMKIKEQEMEIAALSEQEKQLERQLKLQVDLAHNSFLSTKKVLSAKQSQIETAKKYYSDLLKKYKEGQLGFAELLEAQTQITNASLQKSLAIYETWIKYVELERAKASFSFN